MRILRFICWLCGHRDWLHFRYRDGEIEADEDVMVDRVTYKCSICGREREVI